MNPIIKNTWALNFLFLLIVQRTNQPSHPILFQTTLATNPAILYSFNTSERHVHELVPALPGSTLRHVQSSR